MNIYRTEFFATCPVNGVRIKYLLAIEHNRAIPVEQIIAAVESQSEGFHEEIADALASQFPGAHTLTAHHHGVDIETRRTGVDHA